GGRRGEGGRRCGRAAGPGLRLPRGGAGGGRPSRQRGRRSARPSPRQQQSLQAPCAASARAHSMKASGQEDGQAWEQTPLVAEEGWSAPAPADRPTSRGGASAVCKYETRHSSFVLFIQPLHTFDLDRLTGDADI